MRSTLLLITALGCTGPAAFRPAPLPELVVAHGTVKQLRPGALLLAPGEHMIFDVHVHGMSVGRVEVEVGDTEVRSRFKTDSLAEMVMRIDHDLTTLLDRGGARAGASIEHITVDDTHHQFEASWQGATMTVNGVPSPMPGGKIGQTVHSALGVLRGWAAPDAEPGFIAVLVMGNLYRLDVMRPTVEEVQGTKALRIDGRIGAKSVITFAMWLADTPDRTPLRIELSNEDFHVTAELVRT